MKRILGLSLILMLCTTLVEAGYMPENIPPKELGRGSRSFEWEFKEVGTSGTHIRYFGTQSVNGVGTSTGRISGTSSTLPQEVYDWNGGTPTINLTNISSFQINGVDQTVTDDILALNGEGTNTTLNTPNMKGGTQSGNTVLTDNFVIGTETVAKQKVQWMADVTDYVQAQIDSKQANLGGNYLVSISNDIGTNTGAIRLKGTGDIDVTKVGDNLYTINLFGTPTAKPDIKEGGTTTVTGATNIDFNEEHFNVTQDGTGANIDLSEEIIGTSTPGIPNTNIKSDDNGNVDINWIDSSSSAKTLSITNLKLPGTTTSVVGISTNDYSTIQTVKETVYSPYPHDSNTLILYHGEESLGTSLIDHSENARHGTIDGQSLDTVQKKFGTTSIDFPGGANQEVSMPVGTYWNFSGNFTVDFWVRFDDKTIARSGFLYQTTDGHELYYQYSDNSLNYVNNLNSINHVGSWTPNEDQWYHVALVRSGNNINTYVDGIQVGGTSTFSGAISGCGTLTPSIGKEYSGGNVSFSGWIDEYRVSDSARWTTDFTPPTADYHDNYVKYNLRFILPTSNDLLSVVTHGTETHYNNTVLVGTSTQASPGSSSVYALETLNVLGSSYVIRACNSRVKTPTEIDPIRIENNVISSLDASKIFQYRWDNPDDIRNNTDNYGIMLDDGCPPEILSMDGLPEITKWCGYLQVVNKALLRRIKKQRQEIDAIQEILNRNNIR